MYFDLFDGSVHHEEIRVSTRFGHVHFVLEAVGDEFDEYIVFQRTGAGYLTPAEEMGE